ncbi:sterol desaturase family protein [Paraflavitalea pollutisoli]|uniref:sterol desaturase family protein n=1 Tax=Paraflavitalea pollutisoli TaxID=3034143 RepID=UPI0023EC8BC8|nr:sterol desaturase family protein [Paraflavitalea sp. H1-2-19X]
MPTPWELLAKLTFLTFARYFVLAGLFFIPFYVLGRAWFKHQKIQAANAKPQQFLREIRHSAISSAILAGVGFLMAATPIRQYTLLYKEIDAYPVWWLPVSVLLSLVIHDTYFYWMHRGLHDKRIFRHAHAVHHRSTNPSPWAAYSFHFLEAIAEGFILVILVFVLPLHGLSILWFSLASFVMNAYGHLGYEIMPRRFRNSWWFEVLNTSVHHNLHHRQFKGNYGLYFRYWDRLMGTEHPDYVKQYDRVQEQRFGVKNAAMKAA